MRISDWSSDVCSSDLLREEQYVGHHIIPLVREHLTGPTETGLGLVDDEEHAATLAMRLERFEIADGQIDDAAGTQHGLGDKRGEIARRLAIQQVEARSEEHTSELQSLMRISYAVFCLKKKTQNKKSNEDT